MNSLANQEINSKINTELSPYALALPLHISGGETLKIYELLQLPNKDLAKIISEIQLIVMQPHTRALWLENRLFIIPAFKDICSIVDYAYIDYGRGNHVGAYFSLIPIAEGLILRWMGINNRKPSFKEIKDWITNKKNDKTLLKKHPFLPIWTDTISKILCDEFFQDTRNNYTFDYFNRHAGAHLLKLFELNGLSGLVMRLFIMIELLVEIYVTQNEYEIDGIEIPLLYKGSEKNNQRLHAYQISYDWLYKDLSDHPEAILKKIYD